MKKLRKYLDRKANISQKIGKITKAIVVSSSIILNQFWISNHTRVKNR